MYIRIYISKMAFSCLHLVLYCTIPYHGWGGVKGPLIIFLTPRTIPLEKDHPFQMDPAIRQNKIVSFYIHKISILFQF